MIDNYVFDREELNNIEIDGKKLSDLYINDDNEVVDLDGEDKFGVNISNNDNIVIVDLGRYRFDKDVCETTYVNGVDIAVLHACFLFNTSYDEVDDYESREGYDYTMCFMRGMKEFRIEDFLMYYLSIINGTVYISEFDLHVHIKGTKPDGSIWESAKNDYESRLKR